MIKVCVTGISTFLEPSSAASTTTEFAGFVDRTALGALAADTVAHYGYTRCYECFNGRSNGTINTNTDTMPSFC